MSTATEQNMATAWIESQPALTLAKSIESGTTILNLQFDSMMDFDENRDNVVLNLDGKFLQPGWSIKSEIADFEQIDGDDGMSEIKAKFNLLLSNLDDESLTKRYLVHAFNLFIPAKKQNTDGSFDFLTPKENEKLLSGKLKDAFATAMANLNRPVTALGAADANAQAEPVNFRSANNPFAKQAAVPSAATPAANDSNGFTLNQKLMGIAVAALLVGSGITWAITSSGKNDNMQTASATTSQHPSETNPLISANNNDPGAQAALNLTKETLEGMGLPVSQTGADLGCLTN